MSEIRDERIDAILGVDADQGFQPLPDTWQPGGEHGPPAPGHDSRQ